LQPLSLHDALPIYSLSRSLERAPSDARRHCPGRRRITAQWQRQTINIEMRIKIAILTLIVSIAAIRADQSIESVQQALKEQGFYYGEITGEKNADTTAAIRRFQIRHGLQITGELNEETLRSLRSAPSVSSQPAATRTQSRNEESPELRDQSSRETADISP